MWQGVSAVPVQMWQGVSAVPVQMWQGSAQSRCRCMWQGCAHRVQQVYSADLLKSTSHTCHFARYNMQCTPVNWLATTCSAHLSIGSLQHAVHACHLARYNMQCTPARARQAAGQRVLSGAAQGWLQVLT
jgi:hypothetical protein